MKQYWALLDLASSRLQLSIMHIKSKQVITTLEQASSDLDLGYEIYHTGTISVNSIEKIISALNNFQTNLATYQIEPENCYVLVRANVLEASNAQFVMHRISRACNFNIIPLSAAAELYYGDLSLMQLCQSFELAKFKRAYYVQIGDGSLKCQTYAQAWAKASYIYPLGCLKIKSLFEEFKQQSQSYYDLIASYLASRLDPLFTSNLPKKGTETKRQDSQLENQNDPSFLNQELVETPNAIKVEAKRKYTDASIDSTNLLTLAAKLWRLTKSGELNPEQYDPLNMLNVGELERQPEQLGLFISSPHFNCVAKIAEYLGIAFNSEKFDAYQQRLSLKATDFFKLTDLIIHQSSEKIALALRLNQQTIERLKAALLISSTCLKATNASTINLLAVNEMLGYLLVEAQVYDEKQINNYRRANALASLYSLSKQSKKSHDQHKFLVNNLKSLYKKLKQKFALDSELNFMLQLLATTYDLDRRLLAIPQQITSQEIVAGVNNIFLLQSEHELLVQILGELAYLLHSSPDTWLRILTNGSYQASFKHNFNLIQAGQAQAEREISAYNWQLSFETLVVFALALALDASGKQLFKNRRFIWQQQKLQVQIICANLSELQSLKRAAALEIWQFQALSAVFYSCFRSEIELIFKVETN